MTVANMPLLTDQQLAYYYPEAADESQRPNEKSLTKLAVLIWGPSLLVTAGLLAIGQTGLGIIVFAMTGLLDTCLRGRVSIYGLIAAICMFHLIGTVPMVSLAKFVGIWAFLRSIPRLLRAIDIRRIDPAAKFIVPFVALGVMAFPLSAYPMLALRLGLTMAQVYVVSAVMGVWLTCPRYRNMALVVLIGFATILAVQQIRVGTPEVVESWQRVGAVTLTESARVDINEMARLMSIGVLCTIYFFLSQRGVTKKVLNVFVGMVLCIGIVITKTRSCYIGLPAAVILGIVLAQRARIGKRLVAVLAAAFLTVVVFFVGSQFGFLGIGIKERFESIFERGVEAGGRNVYWAAYLRTSLNRGFMPHGLGGTRTSEQANRLGLRGHVAHNDAIDILGDLGLPGLALFIALHVHLFRRIRRMWGKWEQLLAWMFWIFMVVGGIPQTDYLRKYYGLALGLLLVIIRLDEREGRVEQARGAYSYALACQAGAPPQQEPIGPGSGRQRPSGPTAR